MIIPRPFFGKGFYDLVLDFMVCLWSWRLTAFFQKQTRSLHGETNGVYVALSEGSVVLWDGLV